MFMILPYIVKKGKLPVDSRKHNRGKTVDFSSGAWYSGGRCVAKLRRGSL